MLIIFYVSPAKLTSQKQSIDLHNPIFPIVQCYLNIYIHRTMYLLPLAFRCSPKSELIFERNFVDLWEFVGVRVSKKQTENFVENQKKRRYMKFGLAQSDIKIMLSAIGAHFLVVGWTNLQPILIYNWDGMAWHASQNHQKQKKTAINYAFLLFDGISLSLSVINKTII